MLADSWKTLITMPFVALFCGCAFQPQENANRSAYNLQRLFQEQQIQIQRRIIASEVATLPEQHNPFRGSFGERRIANNLNDTNEVCLVNAYNKQLHDKETDAWVNNLLTKSVPKQSMETQSPLKYNLSCLCELPLR